MLILSRKVGERIIVGDGIEIVVLESRRDRVRLGFVAPTEVRIHREEAAGATRQDETANFRLRTRPDTLRTSKGKLENKVVPSHVNCPTVTT